MKSTLFVICLIGFISFSSVYGKTYLKQAQTQTQSQNSNQSGTVVVTASQTNNPDPSKYDTLATIGSAYCFLNVNGIIFDLLPLNNAKADYSIDNTAGTLNYNICGNTLTTCEADKTIKGQAFYKSKIDNSCQEISGAYSFSRQFSVWYNSKQTDVARIEVAYEQGDICETDNTKNNQLNFVFNCDPNSTKDTFSQNFNPLQCSNTITITSKSACPVFGAYSVFNTIISNRFIFGPILMLLGIFVCFFGIKFVKYVEMIAAGFAVSIFFIWLIFSNLTLAYGSWAFWVTLVLSFAAGVIVMIFLGKYDWIGRAIIGGLLGFVGGFFIYNLALRFIQSNPTAVFWVVMVLCIITGIILGILIGKPILMIATGIIGAYGIVRGLSFMAGGFPDERQVYELGQNGEWDQMKSLLTGAVYGYLAGFVVLAIGGIFVQFYFFNEDEKKDNNESDKQNLDN